MKRLFIQVPIVALLLCGFAQAPVHAQAVDEVVAPTKSELDEAVDKVRPALVRIKVVEPSYWSGRENKDVGFGSGTIISPDGYIVTNHHVAGKGVQIICTMPNREEVRAILVGTDPATDIAIIKLQPDEPTEFPFARFGNSDDIRVGDPVLALGSPQALSQSVTLGIISNTEMIMPPSMGSYSFTLDGENVGELVRWFGHDAAIFPGNSGGPLVNMDGDIIGVNEIGMGLGGAIPGNLAREVAETIIEHGNVSRAYMGFQMQPLLKRGNQRKGVLINTVLDESPAKAAEVKPGDILLAINDIQIEGRFAEDLPGINNLISNLPIGGQATLTILRDGDEQEIRITPEKRRPAFIPEKELREWGMTGRDVSLWTALELARDSQNGVLVTSYRSGGPAATARPELREGDIITHVNETEIADMKQLEEFTKELYGDRKEGFIPVLVQFDREAEKFLSVVQIGIDEQQNPGREVVRGWLPMETQVLTREIARQLKLGDMRGVRVTRLYDADEDFPFKVGDIITHLDGEEVAASRKEDADVFELLVRQYPVDSEVTFTLTRDGEKMDVKTKTKPSPAKTREMKRHRDIDFEFVVREATFQDKQRPVLAGVEFTVLVDNVTSGGWASLAGLSNGDAILSIDGRSIETVQDVESALASAKERKAANVVIYVRRGPQNLYLEMEPSW